MSASHASVSCADFSQHVSATCFVTGLEYDVDDVQSNSAVTMCIVTELSMCKQRDELGVATSQRLLLFARLCCSALDMLVSIVVPALFANKHISDSRNALYKTLSLLGGRQLLMHVCQQVNDTTLYTLVPIRSSMRNLVSRRKPRSHVEDPNRVGLTE